MATKQLYSANHYHRLSFGDFGFRIFEEGGTTSSTAGESFCTLHALSDSVVSFASMTVLKTGRSRRTYFIWRFYDYCLDFGIFDLLFTQIKMALGIGNGFAKSLKTTIKIRKIFNRTGDQWQIVDKNWNQVENKWNDI